MQTQITQITPDAQTEAGLRWLENEAAYYANRPGVPVTIRYVGVEKMKAYLLGQAQLARHHWQKISVLRALPFVHRYRAQVEYEVILGLIATFKRTLR